MRGQREFPVRNQNPKPVQSEIQIHSTLQCGIPDARSVWKKLQALGLWQKQMQNPHVGGACPEPRVNSTPTGAGWELDTAAVHGTRRGDIQGNRNSCVASSNRSQSKMLQEHWVNRLRKIQKDVNLYFHSTGKLEIQDIYYITLVLLLLPSEGLIPCEYFLGLWAIWFLMSQQWGFFRYFLWKISLCFCWGKRIGLNAEGPGFFLLVFFFLFLNSFHEDEFSSFPMILNML